MKNFPIMLIYKRFYALKLLSGLLIILTFLFSYPGAKAQDSPAYIPSLNAWVSSFRFFEGPYNLATHDQRNYETLFEKSKTRYIFWELALDHEPPGRNIDFTIEEFWYGPGNKLLTKQNFQSFIRSDWSRSYFYHGYGWKDPGKWPAGAYRVDLYINGAQVASGSFEVYEAETPKKKGKHTIIFGEADKVEEYRKKAELYLEKGDIENYQLTLTRLANAYSARGAYRYLNGDFPGALEDSNEALRINPNLAGTYVIRGHTRFKLGDFQGAIEDYNRAILLSPDDAVAYHYRGIARLGERDSGGFDDLEIAAILYKKESNEEGYQQVQEIIKRLRQ